MDASDIEVAVVVDAIEGEMGDAGEGIGQHMKRWDGRRRRNKCLLNSPAVVPAPGLSQGLGGEAIVARTN